MKYGAYGNIALCHAIARHLETLKLDGALTPFDRADLDDAITDLNRRIQPKEHDA